MTEAAALPLPQPHPPVLFAWFRHDRNRVAGAQTWYHRRQREVAEHCMSNTYTHTNAWTHINTHTHKHTHTRTREHTNTQTRAHTYIHKNTHTHIHTHTCKHRLRTIAGNRWQLYVVERTWTMNEQSAREKYPLKQRKETRGLARGKEREWPWSGTWAWCGFGALAGFCEVILCHAHRDACCNRIGWHLIWPFPQKRFCNTIGNI